MTPEREWTGEHLIRAPKRHVEPVDTAEPPSKSSKTKGRKCIICGTAIYNGTQTGLCRAHVHAEGICRCAQCRRVAG